MRLLILSDLHLERWRDFAPRIDPSVSKPDVVLLAGDIHSRGKAVPWAAANFPGLPVVYVHGNHEAHGKSIEVAHKETREACEVYPNVHFLEQEEFVLEGVRFLGATLWTDFRLFPGRKPEAFLDALATMDDYSRIRVPKDRYRALHPTDTVRIFEQTKSWLKERLSEPFNGKTVVVTHTAPSRKSVAPQYFEDIGSSCFASNLDELVALADLWHHGHMHGNSDYVVGADGKGRVVCNPCGYMHKGGGLENDEFDPNFIVEI